MCEDSADVLGVARDAANEKWREWDGGMFIYSSKGVEAPEWNHKKKKGSADAVNGPGCRGRNTIVIQIWYSVGGYCLGKHLSDDTSPDPDPRHGTQRGPIMLHFFPLAHIAPSLPSIAPCSQHVYVDR